MHKKRQPNFFDCLYVYLINSPNPLLKGKGPGVRSEKHNLKPASQLTLLCHIKNQKVLC